MNKETIITIIFWGAVIIVGLWSLGVFGTETKSFQKSTTTNIVPTSEISIPSFDTNNDSEDESDIPQTFHDYPCTVDCSGHEAGYEWAEEHGITQDDVDNYSGNSNSFMEGMQSYVDEN